MPAPIFRLSPALFARRAATLSLSAALLAPAFLPAPARAQSALPPSAPAAGTVAPPAPRPPVVTPQTVPLRNGRYLLGPGDVVRVTVANYPAYSQDNIVIPPDGALALPNFSKIYATGKTREQVQAELRRILLKTMLDPQVVVTLVSARAAAVRVVYVNGAVNRPGTIVIRDGFRLSELLSELGGVQGALQDVTATLTRRNGTTLKVDLHRALSYPNSPANVRLMPDDNLTVLPVVPAHLVITGDVEHAGVYELHRAPKTQPGSQELPLHPRLSDALIAAGLPQSAASDPQTLAFSGTLSRLNGKALLKIPLDVGAALTQRNGAANLDLRPDDIIDIAVVRPLAPVKLFVDGFVRSPGGFDLPAGSGVLEAVAQAGGLTRLPEDTLTSVVRGGRAIPVDLSELAVNPALNLPLQNGDQVRVSEPAKIRVRVTGLVRTQPTDALRLPPNSTLQDALTAAGGVASLPQDIIISVLRRNAEGAPQVPLSVNPVALLNRNDPSQNVKLRDGDLVSVVDANRARVVYIGGEVAKTGQYTIREGDDIIELIAQAGGPTTAAALTQVKLQRGGRTITLDAFDAIKNGVAMRLPEAALQQGDYVVVPRNNLGVYLTGAVQSQGIIPVPERETLTVLKAISLAGGLLPNAKTQEVVLLRQRPDGKVVRDFLSLSAGARQVAFNTPMQAGDVLYVPASRATPDGLSKVGRTLGLFGSVLAVGSRFGGF